MFNKILKKDLRRKKAMNIILFIFMLTAGILIASSTNLLYSTVTAVDYFIEKSNVADFICLADTRPGMTESIKDWADNSGLVKKYQSEESIAVDEEDISTSTGKKISIGNSVLFMEKPAEYNLIYDSEGKDFDIGPAEIAIPTNFSQSLGLKPGDSMTVKVNAGTADEYDKTFTVAVIFKDVTFGSKMMGGKRVIICEADYSDFKSKVKPEKLLNMWEFTKNNGYQGIDLQKKFNNLNLTTYTVMTRDKIRTLYVFDMILAMFLIIFSIVLILISFLILRFTIVYTITEDYRQIGVMKAIGLRSRSIRGMYGIKYLLLSGVSGIIGLLLSIPVSGVMKRSISEELLLKQSTFNYIISFISILFIVGLTMLFCNFTTRKINKISAIEAIRQGSTGERFKNTKKLSLSRHRRIFTPIFLAISDIRCDFKKYVILIITFILGTFIIIIPNNVVSTLKSKEIVPLFGYAVSDFYIKDTKFGNQEDALKSLNELNNKLIAKGINTDLRADLITTGKLVTEDKSESLNIVGFQGLNISAADYDYLEGKAPELDNEIAITEKAAEALNLRIGDKIICELQGVTDKYVITALFQSLNSFGYGVRFPEGYKADNGTNTGILISGIFNGTKKEREAQLDKLKEIKGLSIESGSDLINTFIGSILDQINSVKNMIIIIVSLVNFLITLLLVRLLISKDKPEVAILKSLGFGNRSIKLWQIFRIGFILIISVFIGTVLANTTGNYLTGGIFFIEGITRLHLVIEPLQVYFLCPLILLIATLTAVFLSLGQIKKTNVWEINNQE